ncbi:MAG: DUF1499 domain-containing protein [Hyphomicrobiales bacterium]|nr:DUF1499 domain-containing protein [Hyphomicrobiales bacterium]
MDTFDFLWIMLLVAVLAVAALLLVAVSFRRVWGRGDRGGGAAIVAVLVSLLVLAPFAVAGVWFFLYPRLNDISTDLVSPPALVMAAKVRNDHMNQVGPITREAAARQVAAYPEITGRRYNASPGDVLGAVDHVIARRGWKIVSHPPLVDGEREYTLEAVAKTFLFGFPSDVAIRLTDEGESTYVDMRSASRYGDDDFGDNAARVSKFLDALDTGMAGQANR